MKSLILLPGLMCDDTVWESQVQALSGCAQCVCADWGGLDSIGAMAESVLSKAPGRFALAGHSMGGRVALEVYRLAPERVISLGLFDTGYGPRPPGTAGEDETRGRMELLDLARSRGIRAMAMKWIPPMIHADLIRDSELVEAIVGMFERKTPDIFAAQIRALLERPDATAVLGSIRCPTLLLVGEADGWSPPLRHRQMAGMIPGSKLVVIPNCGHMSTMERPEEVTQAMRTWLAN